MKKKQEEINNNTWLNPKTLEVEYGFLESTISKYRMLKKIPFYKIGSKYIFYKRAEIDLWIENNKVVECPL